jgi:hypothetical protein
MAIGRISGPLLKANLIRDGVDLAFETDLLYLDVNNSRIGVNTSAPQYTLDVQGTTRTTDLIVSNQLNIGNFTVSGNTISSDLDTISFIAGGGSATAYHSRLLVNDIEINGNVISTANSNANLELRPNGTGIVDIISSAKVNGNLEVTGNIHAVGNIRIDGNLIIGNEITDTITINASIKSDLIPETTTTYDLGSPSFRWNTLYASTIYSNILDLDSFNVGNIQMYDNVITTTNNQNLIIDANGSGVIRIGNFEIRDNTITNVIADSITEITQSGTGYLKISGTNGFVPPAGTTGERPTSYAVGGMMRYNTDSRALEIWDSFVNDWVSPAGTIGAVSESTANDIAIRFALTLG